MRGEANGAPCSMDGDQLLRILIYEVSVQATHRFAHQATEDTRALGQYDPMGTHTCPIPCAE